MEYRLPIQSRRGNLLLIAVGLVFLIAGTGTLVFAIISTWGYAGPADRAMQLVLSGCAAFGALLVVGGLRNLGRRRATA
jgi:phosphoglycerol transferase MdoB-like AlkP superfamily enzyme